MRADVLRGTGYAACFDDVLRCFLLQFGGAGACALPADAMATLDAILEFSAVGRGLFALASAGVLRFAVNIQSQSVRVAEFLRAEVKQLQTAKKNVVVRRHPSRLAGYLHELDVAVCADVRAQLADADAPEERGWP